MGGDHHAHDTLKIPKDHTVYKTEDVPRLMKLKDKLAAQGLKDPWMRNEVYRYKYDTQSLGARIYQLCGGRFMLFGMGIGTLGAVAQYVWDSNHPPPSHHDDDHH